MTRTTRQVMVGVMMTGGTLAAILFSGAEAFAAQPGLSRAGIPVRSTLGDPCAGARGGRRAEGAVSSRGRRPHLNNAGSWLAAPLGTRQASDVVSHA
jgi:hypothetical protein